MKSSDIIAFFARLAPKWDSDYTTKNDAVINIILDNAGVEKGKDVLDVACGTGILIPFYLEREAASVTAIDITPEMADIARKKFPQEQVKVVCGDATETDFGQLFDCIVIYNALPHFTDAEMLIGRLTSLLKEDGILTVAHGMSREMINAVHSSNSAQAVSAGLMAAEELAEIFRKYLNVTTVISDDAMYQVAGKKKD